MRHFFVEGAWAQGLLACALALPMLAGCDNTVDWDGPGVDPPGTDEPGHVKRPIDETPTPASMAIPDSVARYRGEAVVTTVTPRGTRYNGYTFDVESGPRCIGGGEYSVTTRDGSANKLHIFMQGGGACWSEVCLRTDGANVGMPDEIMQIISPKPTLNPMAEWNTLYLPYCDGSLFIGDIDYDDDEDGTVDRFHRGIQNLSAAVDVAVERWGEPDEIVLSGLSAGGYGTVFATLLIRKVFPNVPIRVFNDSGVGINRGERDPDFLHRLVEEWNGGPMIPESCDGCLDGGHLASFVQWVLGNDENLRFSAFSYDRDSTIAGTFMGVGGEFFEEELSRILPELEASFPDQYRYAVLAGDGHTTLGFINVTEINGVRLSTWIQAMLDNSPEWTSMRQR